MTFHERLAVGGISQQLCQNPGSSSLFPKSPSILPRTPWYNFNSEGGGPSSSSLVKKLLMYLFFPVAIPVVIYKVVKSFREKFGLKQRPLEGKVVLITGASSGIGKCLSALFYASGCRLILVSRRLDALEKVKDEILTLKTYGPVYIPAILQIDLEDLNQIPEKAQEILNVYGYIDILINNAGISFRGSALDTTIEVDEKVMKINYLGPITLTKRISKSMVHHGSGQIVFISSVQGKIAIPNRTAYAASKHAVQAFADSLRAELAINNISVTVISPGYVQTNLSLNAITSTGSLHGQTDNSTAHGSKPEAVAKKIMSAIMKMENDVVIATFMPRFAIFLRYMWPNMFFRLMAMRAVDKP